MYDYEIEEREMRKCDFYKNAILQQKLQGEQLPSTGQSQHKKKKQGKYKSKIVVRSGLCNSLSTLYGTDL